MSCHKREQTCRLGCKTEPDERPCASLCPSKVEKENMEVCMIFYFGKKAHGYRLALEFYLAREQVVYYDPEECVLKRKHLTFLKVVATAAALMAAGLSAFHIARVL